MELQIAPDVVGRYQIRQFSCCRCVDFAGVLAKFRWDPLVG
ncbi:hypothetical protein [Halobellus ordinarius]|nr:hypothetical protein [Halobellus sp. ZY16]